jgi:hypothetical protein
LLKNKLETNEKLELTSSPVFKKMNIFAKKTTQLNSFTKNVPSIKSSGYGNRTNTQNNTATITSFLTQVINCSVEKKYKALADKSEDKSIMARLHNLEPKTRNKYPKQMSKNKYLNFSLNPNNTTHSPIYNSIHKTISNNKIKISFNKDLNPIRTSKSPANRMLQSPNTSYTTNFSKIDTLMKNTMNKTLNMKIHNAPEKIAESYNFKTMLSKNVKTGVNYQLYKTSALKKKHINLSGLSKSRDTTSKKPI